METPLNVADLAIAIAPLAPDVRVVDADGQDVVLHLAEVDGRQVLMIGQPTAEEHAYADRLTFVRPGEGRGAA